MTWPTQTVFASLLAIVSSLLVASGAAQVTNTNPNYAAIREFGHIQWHGDTATIVAGGSRPLDMAAFTLSTCLGLSVSSEDPQYHHLGDLLDVTAPQWTAQHPEDRVYAGRPGKVEVTFSVRPDGSPSDTSHMLDEIVQQINEQQPYAFKLHIRTAFDRTYYSFVPTRTRDEKGVLLDAGAYLDTSVSIPEQTSTISNLASVMTRLVSEASDSQFSCCQAIVIGYPWGERSVTYQAKGVPAREVLEDLMARTGAGESYSLRCQPLDKRFCFINVHDALERPHAKNGECTAPGYDSR